MRFAEEGPENWRAHCHCESSRRQTASPFAGVADVRWRWTGAEPGLFQSSPGFRRYCCATCGSPVAYGADRFPGERHVCAGLLDNRTGFVPERHVHSDERAAWTDRREQVRRADPAARPADLPDSAAEFAAGLAVWKAELGEAPEIEFPPVRRFFALEERIQPGDRIALIALRNCEPPHQLRAQWVAPESGPPVVRSGRMQSEVERC